MRVSATARSEHDVEDAAQSATVFDPVADSARLARDLGRIAEAIRQSVGAKQCLMFLWDGTANQMRMVIGRDASARLGGDLPFVAIDGMDAELGEAIRRRRRAIINRHGQITPLLMDLGADVPSDVGDWLCEPIVGDDGLLGILMLCLSAGASLDESDVAVVEDWARLAGLAISRHEPRLADKSRLLQATLDNIGEGVCVQDENLRLLCWNDRFFELFGLPERFKRVGTRLEDFARHNAERGLYGPGDVEEHIKNRVALARRGLTEHQQFIDRIPNGPTIEFDRHPLPGGGLVTTYRDITDRLRHEQALRDSEARLRAIFNSAGLGIILFSPDGRVVQVNPAFESFLGYSAAELVGKHNYFYTHPDEIENTGRRFGKLVTGQVGTYSVAKRYRRKTGEEVWGRLTMSVVMKRDGRAQLLLAMIEDVTAQRRAEEALRASEERFRRTFEAAGIGMTLMDEQGRLIEVNPAFARMHGYAPDELIGRSHLDVSFEGEQAQATANLAAFVSGEMSSMVREKRLRRKNGSLFWGRVTVSTMPSPDPTPKYFLSMIEDITEQKEAQLALVEAKEAAETANRIKSEFLANVSHEIRTPMNSILGFTDLLGRTDLGNKQKVFVRSVDEAASALMALINDVLDLSKLESGRFKLAAQRIDPKAEALSALDTIRGMPEAGGLELKAEFGALPNETVLGDSKRLRQVLLNLFGNAVKFTERGTVTVRVRQTARRGGVVDLLFEIIDSGMGIAPDALEELFTPFVQADGSISRRFGGTGLGLSISRNLVDLMGGQIGVESELGQGSGFWFSIPFALADAAAVAPQSAVPSPTSAVSKTVRALDVLVAEDSEANRLLIVTFLEAAGHRVEVAVDGTDACERAAAKYFDVILMDVQMPQCDGLTATHTIRSGNGPCRNAPIIAVTAHAMAEDRVRCFEAGMNDYLTKPLGAEALLAMLAKVSSPQAAGDLDIANDAENSA